MADSDRASYVAAHQDVANQDVASHVVANQDVASQDVASHVVANQDVASHVVVNQAVMNPGEDRRPSHAQLRLELCELRVRSTGSKCQGCRPQRRTSAWAAPPLRRGVGRPRALQPPRGHPRWHSPRQPRPHTPPPRSRSAHRPRQHRPNRRDYRYRPRRPGAPPTGAPAVVLPAANPAPMPRRSCRADRTLRRRSSADRVACLHGCRPIRHVSRLPPRKDAPLVSAHPRRRAAFSWADGSASAQQTCPRPQRQNQRTGAESEDWAALGQSAQTGAAGSNLGCMHGTRSAGAAWASALARWAGGCTALSGRDGSRGGTA